MHGRRTMDYIQNDWAQRELRKRRDEEKTRDKLRRVQGELVTEVAKDTSEPTRLVDIHGRGPEEYDIHVAENEGMPSRPYA